MIHQKSSVLKALARVHLDVGQYEAAQNVCRQILKRNAKDADAIELMRQAVAQEAKLAENLFDETEDENATALRHRSGAGKYPLPIT